MKKQILQLFGDKILSQAQKALDSENYVLFQKIYDVGILYNDMCINFFDVYLD